MRHAGQSDPGDDFDALYAETAARVTSAGGTPLPNETASSSENDEEEASDG